MAVNSMTVCDHPYSYQLHPVSLFTYRCLFPSFLLYVVSSIDQLYYYVVNPRDLRKEVVRWGWNIYTHGGYK